MKIIQFFTFLCFMQLVTGGREDDPSVIKGLTPKMIFHLGSVVPDLKDYFADNIKMNWTKAQKYCENLGLELATITSQNQANFLRLRQNATDFSGFYWIGARDAQLPRALSWDKSGSTLQKFTGLPYGNAVEEYQLCGLYSASSDATRVLLQKFSYEDAYVLCQA